MTATGFSFKDKSKLEIDRFARQNRFLINISLHIFIPFLDQPLVIKNLKTRPQTECDDIHPGQFCPDEKKVACSIGVGSPIQVFPSGSFVAKVSAIVVSDASGTCAYTKIPYYLDWIQSHVWPLV